MNKTIWSEEYSCYVSYAPKKLNNIKIDITKCVIKITCFGFYELWLGANKVRSLKFLDFMKYKKYVKEVIQEVDYV